MSSLAARWRAMGAVVDQIREESAQLDPVKAVLTLLTLPLFLLGWVAAKVAGLVWTVVAWSYTAVLVGWREARRGERGGG